jgi:hypothetical protein
MDLDQPSSFCVLKLIAKSSKALEGQRTPERFATYFANVPSDSASLSGAA